MDKETQEALNKRLFEAMEQNNAGEVASLLHGGADVNARHCEDGCRQTPLMQAAMKGFTSVAQVLLENGADTALLDSEKKTAVELAGKNNKPELAVIITAFDEEKKSDRVIFYNQIGDRVRQDVYDFLQQERLTLIRQSRFGTVESAIITGFSAIEDHSDTSLLRKAFDEHTRRGGKTEEEAVFPNRVYKPVQGLHQG